VVAYVEIAILGELTFDGHCTRAFNATPNSNVRGSALICSRIDNVVEKVLSFKVHVNP